MRSEDDLAGPIDRARRAPTRRRDLVEFYEVSALRPAVTFVAAVGIWLALVAVALWSDSLLVRTALVVPLALAAGNLFVIGHDAAHGSFSTSHAANAVIGRVAFVPSIHVFGLWQRHHNVHHRFTNLRSRDFVWTPLSVDDYERLSRVRRVMHRCYRSETGLGLGLHYIVEIWVPRMLYPTRAREGRRRRNLFRDTAALHVMLAGVGFGAYRFAVFCDERRADDLGYWLTSALFVVVLPLLGTHWLIGFVIYLNHTHPNIVWYDDPAMWGSRDVQLECSADVVLRSAMPQRIMHHTAHHVNTRVPLRRLADAQQRLIDDGDGQVTSYRWSRREFVAVLRACKLYDYEAREWLGFDGVPTAPVTVQHGGVQ